MLKIVCWKWNPPDGIHPKKKMVFSSHHVNVLRNMLKRNLKMDHQLVCITDNPSGIDPDIPIIPLWSDYAELGGCYRRLRLFSNEMHEMIGPRFASIDIDTVITQDVTPIFDCKDDFKIWGDTHPKTPYNGSLFIMNAGSRHRVWDEFSENCKGIGRRYGYVGTDQAWIAACLGSNESRWTICDGIYSFRVHHAKPRVTDMDSRTRMVFFHGSSDPSQILIQNRYKWVRDNWL